MTIMQIPIMNMINKLVIEPELLESLYWGNGFTLDQIGDIFGCGHTTIRNRMIEYGIPCRDSHDLTSFTFNDRQKQIFEGCMLGDGNLIWHTHNCFFGNTDKHEDYLLWLQKQLGVEHISVVSPNYRDGFFDYKHTLKTRVIPSIREEHKRWYPYETRHGTYEKQQPKIIPKDVELTPIKLLFWYIGDGHYLKDRKTVSFGNSLVFEDWLPLSKKICKILNVDSGISMQKQRKDKYGVQIYKLSLSKSVTRKFFDIVDNLGFDIPNCYLYKFGR